MRRAPRRVVLWAPVVGYMALIFAASSTAVTTDAAPQGFDKLAHFAAYAGLAVLVVRALSRRWIDRVTLYAAVTAFVVATLYGASDEFHQSFVPGRSTDALDLLADAAGAAVASAALWAWGIIGQRNGL